MIEAVRTSETSVNLNVTTQRYIPEHSKIHSLHYVGPTLLGTCFRSILQAGMIITSRFSFAAIGFLQDTLLLSNPSELISLLRVNKKLAKRSKCPGTAGNLRGHQQ
jgi:hypothetical protein